jgi:hypothetical protein
MKDEQEAIQAVPVSGNFMGDTLHRSREILGEIREVPDQGIDKVFAEGYDSEFWKELYKVIQSIKSKYDLEAKALATREFDVNRAGLAFIVNTVIQEALDTIIAKVEMSYKSILMVGENERTTKEAKENEVEEGI